MGPTPPHPTLWFLLPCLGLKDAPESLGGPKALNDPVVLLRRSESLSYWVPCLCISGDVLGTPLHCRGNSGCGQWSSLSKMPCRDRHLSMGQDPALLFEGRTQRQCRTPGFFIPLSTSLLALIDFFFQLGKKKSPPFLTYKIMQLFYK